MQPGVSWLFSARLEIDVGGIVRRHNHSLGPHRTQGLLAGGRGRIRRFVRMGLLITGIAAIACGLMACSEDFSSIDDALGDTGQRIEQIVVPPIVEETQVVLRNFVNTLALFPEVCAMPVGELGDFVSGMPELQRAQQQFGDTFTINDLNGSWRATWRDVIFGDQDGQLSGAEADTPSVDVMLTVRFRDAGFNAVRAVPFLFPVNASIRTIRRPSEPPACTAQTPEGYYLFQDESTGVWTLSWCAQDTSKVFRGAIQTQALTRISRKASATTTEEVESLTVNVGSTLMRFEETTAPMVTEGIRFFVRPGDFIDFELEIGPEGGGTTRISREQLRLGGDESFLPANLGPGDFELTTEVPVVPTGRPDFTPGSDFGSFVWREDVAGPCTAADETLWRLRFSTPTRNMFSGFVRIADDDAADPGLRVFRVGRCQSGLLEFEDSNERLNYECEFEDATESGYDVCVSGAQRVQFSPEANEVRDPSRVSIGEASSRPQSQDPFSILFDLEILERESAQNLDLQDARVTLLSTTEDGSDDGLRADQVSLEALCRPSGEIPVHVRLIGVGEYATERFEGSRFDFDDVEFTDALQTRNVSAERLPNLGEMEFRTRDEDDDVVITVPVAEFANTNGRVTSSIDLTLTLDTLELKFLDQIVNLSLE